MCLLCQTALQKVVAQEEAAIWSKRISLLCACLIFAWCRLYSELFLKLQDPPIFPPSAPHLTLFSFGFGAPVELKVTLWRGLVLVVWPRAPRHS